jgi:tRNA threonylcarbamoyladenosine biosynthesis protein TsaE
LTNNRSQTEKIGGSFAKSILKRYPAKRAIVFGLEGDLGGGKTTFLQGFARGLGIREKILSPTFILMRRSEIKNSCFENFYHLDCYRIENPKDILSLGLKRIIANPRNIVAVEWADRIKRILPRESVMLKFEFIDKNKRKIIVRGGKNGK